MVEDDTKENNMVSKVIFEHTFPLVLSCRFNCTFSACSLSLHLIFCTLNFFCFLAGSSSYSIFFLLFFMHQSLYFSLSASRSIVFYFIFWWVILNSGLHIVLLIYLFLLSQLLWILAIFILSRNSPRETFNISMKHSYRHFRHGICDPKRHSCCSPAPLFTPSDTLWLLFSRNSPKSVLNMTTTLHGHFHHGIYDLKRHFC